MNKFDWTDRLQEDSGGTIQGDVQLLSIGYMLIIAYVAIMLGQFTRLHIKVIKKLRTRKIKRQQLTV